jgi:hypothetical protein
LAVGRIIEKKWNRKCKEDFTVCCSDSVTGITIVLKSVAGIRVS